MDELRKKSVLDFDRAYLQMVVEHHQQAILLFERQAQAKLGDGELQAYIGVQLPVLRRHLAKAIDLQKDLTGTNTPKSKPVGR